MASDLDPARIVVDPETPLPAGSTVIIEDLTLDNVIIRIDKLVINMPDQSHPTVQEKYRHMYTLTAIFSGILFIAFLALMSILVPNPTPFQLRVWLALLALAAAAFSCSITGLLNLKAKIGTQLAIGASGALGVLVLFYLFKPAGL